MSILWDPRTRKPQVWVYCFFILIPVILFLVIYNYGNSRAGKMDMEKQNTAEVFK